MHTVSHRDEPLMTGLDWLWLAFLLVAFAPALLALEAVWRDVDFASHGYLVPLVSLWALWERRDGLRKLPREPRMGAGLLLLVAAMGLYLVGIAGALPAAQGIALVGAVVAIVWATRGAGWLRALAFPLGYLIFMVPPPSAWVTPVIVQLQLFSSSVAVWLLQMAGQSVLRHGNVIELPGGETLFVDEACSGITSIVTLIPIGVFLAYLTERRNGARLALVACVVPLALAGNLVRVIGTVIAAQYFGAERATEGTLHEWAGMLTYILACLGLVGLGRLLKRGAGPLRA